MYVGHVALGLLLKSLFPHIPSFPIIVGTGWLDILDGIFIILGINTVTPNPPSSPLHFDLTFIDWDHSLLAATLLSLLWGLFFYKKREVAIIASISSFSHWLSDWPVHDADLALYPYSSYHFGFNLWGKLGILSFFLEVLFVFILASITFYLNSKRGVSWKYAYFFLIFLIINHSPWTSPMKHISTLSRPLADKICGFIVSFGFAVPCYILSRIVDSAESKRKIH